MFPWKEPKERVPLAGRQIRSFLRAHRFAAVLRAGFNQLHLPGGKSRMSKALATCAVLLFLAEARAQSDWKKEWEKTIEGAKKEGQVNVYIGGWEAVLESGAFQKAYSEIKMTWGGGRGGESGKRPLAERRGRKV